MAETGKTKTYSDAIDEILSKSVVLSSELLNVVENFIRENAQLGYTTREEFIQAAVCFHLKERSEEGSSHPKLE